MAELNYEVPPELGEKASDLIGESREYVEQASRESQKVAKDAIQDQPLSQVVGQESDAVANSNVLFVFGGINFTKGFVYTLVGAAVLIGLFVFLDKSISTPKVFKNLDKYISKHIMIAPIFIALLSSFVFGAIDNFGLFFGMDAVESFIKQIFPNVSDKTIAGLGNTFSDILGAFVGASVANILTKVLRVHIDPSPTIDAIGITLGCLLPVALHNLGFL